MTTSLLDQVSAVVADDLAVEPPAPDDDLVAAGLLDSLALVTLVVSLEDVFAVSIPLDRVDADAFRTVGSISALVAEALAAT